MYYRIKAKSIALCVYRLHSSDWSVKSWSHYKSLKKARLSIECKPGHCYEQSKTGLSCINHRLHVRWQPLYKCFQSLALLSQLCLGCNILGILIKLFGTKCVLWRFACKLFGSTTTNKGALDYLMLQCNRESQIPNVFKLICHTKNILLTRFLFEQKTRK